MINDDEVVQLRQSVNADIIDVADALMRCPDYCYAPMINEFEEILDEMDEDLTDDERRHIGVELLKSKQRENWSLINA
ncbi:hypothetical protein [Luteibacter sp. UNC138MFCol5.1]|uniref:hypothetical protein n=1 Tax=Luteibacter sp. UNC138MFCol5.1 TaxID=1502774 RepID=UPI000A84DEF9|nr:hypothetical protein [Luteibacter sp. UNC138MFCol5.1]